MITQQYDYLNTMLHSCESVTDWNLVKVYAENEFKSFVLTINWLDQMKTKNEMNAEQARIYIDIQKTTMRTRMMAMPGMNMIEAEHLINTAIDSIRKSVYERLGWVLY